MRRLQRFVLAGLVVSALLALVVSGFASSAPDGLEKVAEEHGFIETAAEHLFGDGPIADYAIRGIENERLSTGLAGLLGVALTYAVGWGLFRLARRRDARRDGSSS